MVTLPVALDDSGVDHINMQQIFSGYLLLCDVGILKPSLPGKNGNTFALELMDNVFKVCILVFMLPL